MITIALNEAAEDRLRAKAEAKGLDAEAYAKELLEGLLLPPTGTGQNGHTNTEDHDDEPFPVLEWYVPSLTKDELYK